MPRRHFDLDGCWETIEGPFCEGAVVSRADLGLLEVDYVEGFDEALDNLEADRAGGFADARAAGRQ